MQLCKAWPDFLPLKHFNWEVHFTLNGDGDVAQQVTKENYLHETQFALLGCQLVEEGLKSYICTAYEAIRLSGSNTNIIKHTVAEIEELALGPLIRLFEPLNANATLITKLKGLCPKRNHCAHKAFVPVFMADVRLTIDLNAEFEKVKEARVFAWDTFQILTPELQDRKSVV